MELNKSDLNKFQQIVINNKMTFFDIVQSLPKAVKNDYQENLLRLLFVNTVLSNLDVPPEFEKIISEMKKNDNSLLYFSEYFDFLCFKLGVGL